MRWFKRVALLMAVVAVVAATAAFFLENQTSAVISLVGWETPALPLSFFVLLAFSGGGVMGVLLGVVLAVRYRARWAATAQELLRCRAALEKERGSP